MDSFYQYLQYTKGAIKNTSTYSDIHIVIGNESCDMDSTVSSILFSYFLHANRFLDTNPKSVTTLIIAVLNVSYKNFLLRTENCFILQEAGISLDWLIFRDQIDVPELLKTKNISTTLVDHHILSKNDAIMEKTVVQIFDHRPIDSDAKWDKQKVKLNIQQVGSCSSLIAEEIFRVDEQLLTKEFGYLIYETILFDTQALLPENGRAKKLDIDIVEKLEKKFNFTDRKAVYDKLWTAHNDVSHLTPEQLLSKDLKIVESIPVPGVPMLVEYFLKLDGAYEAVDNFSKNHKSHLIVLIGLEAKNEVKRDIAIFWKAESSNLKDILVNKLHKSEELKGYNFSFNEISTNYKNILCLRQGNIKLSRKQVVPIIKDAVLEEKCNCKN